jgi:choline dehydrogenase-like flavoprotein
MWTGLWTVDFTAGATGAEEDPLVRSLTADLAVVGSGPTGIAVALEACRAGLSTLLVTGGRRREDAAARDLHVGEASSGPWPHESLEVNRRRAVGGSATAWAGRVVPLDPIDFEQREWIAHSGWPITYEDYAAWGERGCELLGVGRNRWSFDGGPLLTGGAGDDGHRSDDPGAVDEDSVERWAPRDRMIWLLDRDPHLRRCCTVLHDTHVTRMDLEGSRVVGLQARDGPAGDPVEIRASRYVLAAGGLENARLLLHTQVHRDLPSVGRFYMSHLLGARQPVRTPSGLPVSTAFFRDEHIYCRRRFRLTPAAQEAARVGSAVAYFGRPGEDDLGMYGDPVTSAAALARAARAARRLGGPGIRMLSDRRQELLGHAKVVAGAGAGLGGVLGQGLRRASRQQPMLLPDRARLVHHLEFQTEHLPSPRSAVVLGESLDAHGVRRLQPRISISDQDFATVNELHRQVGHLLERRGAVLLRSAEEVTEQYRASLTLSFNSHSHHIGTTRMGVSRTDSVVDRDCRVHTLDNVYVAGSSVFPTGGHANPTLSLVMLAARLGAHLGSTTPR